jgi:hypothetical protein
MCIAIIGWGSLIWDPRDLPRDGMWESGGPILPIEFSRVSRDCRLTAVIDYEHGAEVQTRYVLSPRVDIDDAVNDLRSREDTVKKHIGFVDVKNGIDSATRNTDHRQDCDAVRRWLGRKHFSGGVWTALRPNFRHEIGRDFSIDRAIEYLVSLPISARLRALEYIRNAPLEVDTHLRRKLLEMDLV